ncbi:MAG: pseudouridine synthase, partial [Bacteroidia bacterium]
VDELEQAPRLSALREIVEAQTRQMAEVLKAGKARLRANKADRKRQREEARESMSEEAYDAFNQTLIKASNRDQWLYKELVRKEQEALGKYEAELEAFTAKIASLKAERRRKSAALQERIFEQYQFLNKDDERKNLRQIFTEIGVDRPPSGAGDCAAPRLLQYAFSHDLKPIAMAEFWWGVSPPKEVRKHRYYYPACNGRCKPILGHMLQGIEMDENPMMLGPSKDKVIKIVYEDESLAIINKPHEFLSVPGKQVSESVYTRMRAQYPDASGPLIVHRLDMSTSGIMVIAKTEEAYQSLQQQFINRSVKKRYTALLDGIVEEREGEIDLPLRVDLDDRPRQLVCYEHGKKAVTRWKALEVVGGKTRVHFYPITGRTHQLRVHASHPKGLNTPIVGDDIYGRKADRLHLHAGWIEFDHPRSGELVSFEVEAAF